MRDPAVTTQRRLNFEMSVKNLYQSFQDRERVPKIQGLLNECMTFLDDELSVITGPYEDLLSIDEVIDQELILFVTLNVNKNTEPVRALGKMLLQNLQLVVGKRYESEDHRRRSGYRPMFSVVLDEFAPFGYGNFAQILQTARGTNTAFLFSMQSLPQLMRVGRALQGGGQLGAQHDHDTPDPGRGNGPVISCRPRPSMWSPGAAGRSSAGSSSGMRSTRTPAGRSRVRTGRPGRSTSTSRTCPRDRWKS